MGPPEAIENLSGLSLKLELVRDAFVFSCYTGLVYVDLKNRYHFM